MVSDCLQNGKAGTIVQAAAEGAAGSRRTMDGHSAAA
jgi:hypothetical protein